MDRGCRPALAIAPRSAALHQAIGRARFLQGRLGESRGAFAEAMELEPANAENYAKIGRTYESEGRFEEAIAWQEKAIARQPDNPEAHYCFAARRILERVLGSGASSQTNPRRRSCCNSSTGAERGSRQGPSAAPF